MSSNWKKVCSSVCLNLFLSSGVFGQVVSSNVSAGNPTTTVTYINAGGNPVPIALLSGLNTCDATLTNALNSIAPSRDSFGNFIVQNMAFSFSDMISSHLDSLRMSDECFFDDPDECCCCPTSKTFINRSSAWILGGGGIAGVKSMEQNPSFKFNSEEVIAGLDYRGVDGMLGGVAAGYAHSHFYEYRNAGHGNINCYFGSLYGSATAWNFYVSPIVWVIFDQNDNTRHISFPGFSENAHADIDAWLLVPHLEVGYDIERCSGYLTPFTSLDWAITWQRGYQESGAAPFNAKSRSTSNSMMRSETGFKISERWEYNWGEFLLNEKTSYVYQRPFGTGTVTSSLTGITDTFTVTAVNRPLNLIAAELNFVASIGTENPTLVSLGCQGEVGNKYWSSEFNLSVSKDF